jgi:hypothetical protein
LELIKCGIDFFGFEDKNKIKAYNIDNFVCTKQKNHTIAGNFYSKYMHYVEIKLRRCVGGQLSNKKKPCATKTAIDNFISQRTLSFAFTNNYFDANNYTQPI